MKKILIGLAILIFLPASALAYSVTITDGIDNFPGANGTTETYSITVETNPALSFSILTNQPQYASSFFGTSYAEVADLFLDRSGNGAGWDYAIPLVTHDGLTAGKVYGQIRLGAFDSMWSTDGVPYRISSGTTTGGSGTWTWTNAGGNPDYNILYSGANWSWGDVFGEESVRIAWATASCKNDIIVGVIPPPPSPVPEPATMLLLGFGLVGLVGLRKRFHA